ncbi:alpha-amylase family glycosyl hydrolase [Granulicoccus sp. GXG6511]|uniref:alpha-amylase family glycosyl hydrolase n=1 Tax=Granulicoccus sp. GXG6511 TaxID=3381351 RepID=UPI003D7EC064
MSLLDHAIWWQIYPLGAVGAPIHGRRVLHFPGEDAGHRLRQLDAWLDYAIELGCSGLLLGPIFESTAHGYDTVDHLRLDGRLGDDADWDHFVAECHRRGLAIVLDGVFNHVGVLHPLVEECVAAGGGMVRVRDGVPEPWEGHGDLALLDHSDPRVADFVVDVMVHWLGRGAAGWRLDVAYAVPAEFWTAVIRRVREHHPDAIFIGEVIHGDYAEIARAASLDSVTQYELWKAIWSSLVDQNMWELAWALQRHDEFSRELVTQTFVGNHDVDRIASKVGDVGAALAAVVLMTVPGMPSVYYGDEQGFRGEKVDGQWADAPVRPPLPPAPADLAPNGAWLFRIYQDLIGLRRRNAWVTRGRLEVTGKQDEWITYDVMGDGGRMSVRLDLGSRPRAEVLVNGAPAYAWQAD